MPSRSAKLAPAIVWLIVVWASFVTSPTSFLEAVTKPRAISTVKVPRRFFRVGDPATELSDAVEVKASAREPSKERNDHCDRPRSSGLISSGKKKPPPRKKQILLPANKYPPSPKKSPSPFSADELAALLGRGLAQPVLKDDFLFTDQFWGTFHRSTLTLPMLENLEFQGAARSRDGARETAMLLAACHVKQKLLQPQDHHPKTQLSELFAYAFGIPPRKGDIIYTSQSLRGVTECTVTLPILKETELKELKAEAKNGTDAEKAAALVAIQELEARLTAMGDARKEKKLEELKATAENGTDAEKAAALVAIQELEARLTAMGDARKAKKDQHDAFK